MRMCSRQAEDNEWPWQNQRASASSRRKWSHTGASVLAHIIPEAAAAGMPMPGWHESPHLGSIPPQIQHLAQTFTFFPKTSNGHCIYFLFHLSNNLGFLSEDVLLLSVMLLN